MEMTALNGFVIRVRESKRRGASATEKSPDSLQKLQGAVEQAYKGIPRELAVRWEPEATHRPEDAGRGEKFAHEIEGFLVILSLATHAVEPILKFIVDLARARRAAMTIRQIRSPSGTVKQELTYTGPASRAHLEQVIEDSVRSARVSPSAGEPSSKKALPSVPDLEIELVPENQDTRDVG